MLHNDIFRCASEFTHGTCTRSACRRENSSPSFVDNPSHSLTISSLLFSLFILCIPVWWGFLYISLLSCFCSTFWEIISTTGFNIYLHIFNSNSICFYECSSSVLKNSILFLSTGAFSSGCFYLFVYVCVCMYVMCVRAFLHVSDKVLIFDLRNEVSDRKF